MSPDETDIEQLGRDAAAARMASLPPVDEEAALTSIRSELASGGSSRRPLFFGAAAAAVLLVVVLAVVFTRSDDTTHVVTPTTDTTSTASTTTTVPVAPTAPAFAGMPVWPFSGGMPSPSAAAESFATDYLGMTNPSVEADGSTVTVRVRGRGAPVVVDTRQTQNGWVVMGASSDQIVLDGLKDGDPAPSVVRGQGTAFEAVISIEVRPFGSLTPTEETTAMGGSSELGPFEASLQNGAPGVLIVYEVDASGEGRTNYATVVRIDNARTPSFPAPLLIATKSSGQTVTVDSGEGMPIDGTPEPSRSVGGIVATESSGHIRLNDVVVGPGSLPTMHPLPRATIEYVDPNGLDVWRVEVLSGKAELLFTAQHRITSLDADFDGRLVFTDDQTGLWRWDGPENVAGPVKMADGYVNASW